MAKSDSGLKFDKARIDRILALSFELTNLELSQLINELNKMSQKRVSSDPSDKTDTISV